MRELPLVRSRNSLNRQKPAGPSNSLQKFLAGFDFEVPRELLALKPAQPRDAARLMVVDRKSRQVAVDRFRNIGRHLPVGAVLVFNQTKVIPARLAVVKPTGGKVRLLILAFTKDGSKDTKMSTTKVKALAERTLPVGMRLRCGKTQLMVRAQRGNEYFLDVRLSPDRFSALLERAGKMPLPPYLRASKLSETQRRKFYQTEFARFPGSVAAPTASLHFTKRLLRQLQKAGFGIEFVTLHVGLGTFAPVGTEQLQKRRLHREHYSIDKQTARRLEQAKRAGCPIIAVGTTSLRTLESAATQSTSRQASLRHGPAFVRLKKFTGSTTLFILPSPTGAALKNPLRFVDGLITNFHVPRSSLILLVAALVGRKKILQLYKLAVQKRFRFFSLGDGMLVI